MKNRKLTTHRKMFNKRLQAGDFMVSLTVALIIVALLSVGVFIAYRENTRKIEAGKTVETVTATAAGLQKSFGMKNQYSTVTTAVAVQFGTIPNEQRDGTALTASNSYGGAITVVPTTLTASNDAADLTYQMVPSTQCVDVVLGTEAVGRQVKVGSTVVKAIDASVVMATLAAACEATTNVAIVWSVGRTGT